MYVFVLLVEFTFYLVSNILFIVENRLVIRLGRYLDPNNLPLDILSHYGILIWFWGQLEVGR